MIFEWLLLVAAAAALEGSPEHEVICAETGFSRAAEAKDREAFIRFVDPDARFVSGQVAKGREEIAAAWAGLLAPDGPVIRWRPEVVEVTADGQLALSHGPYRVTSTDEHGVTSHSWGHFNSTWRRSADGAWRVVFDIGGDAGMSPSPHDIAVLEEEPDCP